MPITSRLLFSFVAIVTAVGAHLADFSDTHIFNPDWSGHAKYHTGHTMALSVALGFLTLFFAWRRSGDPATNLMATAGFASVYWISQAAAIFYPNTVYFDPEFDLPANYIMGLPAQGFFQIFFLAMTALATVLALRAFRKGPPTGVAIRRSVTG